MPHPSALRVFTACLLAVGVATIVPTADTTAQAVPFAQDWSNSDLITTSDDWGGVHGIAGYRGDGLVSMTGIDPQTVLGEGTLVVDVNANQANPSTFATGGVAEFTEAGTGNNAVVALQGSGTADAPHLVITVTTAGLSAVTVSYNLRDVDGSADNAVQSVALQYRVGTTGNYVNVPGGFVADATTGPGLATLVTPVSVTLPAAAADKPIVQFRVITTDAGGSDEWVGIDDIHVTGSHIVETTNPAGNGAARPNAVDSGATTLLTVAVTSGENPVSTDLSVTADLSAIGGIATQPFADDATNGDMTAGDLTFSFLATVDAGIAPGSKTLPVTIRDAQWRTGTASINLTVTTPPAPVTTDVVISQLYGGGGNSGATFTHDFIELFNRGAAPVTLTGWSLQYGAAGGSGWSVDTLSGVIQPSQYFLVQQARGSAGTTPLPAPDDTGGLAMSGSAGKVALVGNATALTGTCPAGTLIADFVGYGTSANCFEGSGPAPTLSNTTAAIRVNSAVDTNDNAVDFQEGPPAPHNVSGIPPSAAGLATPAAVASGAPTLLTVTVTPGAAPASMTFSVSANLSSIGFPEPQIFYDDGVNGGDVVANDRTFSWTASISGDPGFRTITATVSDDRSRTALAVIRVAVEQTSTLSIAAIQGSETMSTLAGEFVTTAGIVTAHRSNGFFIQTPDGMEDGNPLTSEGLFVFTGFGAPLVPAAGDFVHVSGMVAEFVPETIAFGRPTTEISGGPAVVIASSGRMVPSEIQLLPDHTPPGGGAEQLERFEGMRVGASLRVAGPTDGTKFESSATSASNGDFMAVVLGVNRPAREPGIDPTQNVPDGTSPSVPRFDGNFERLRVDSDGRGGARLEVVGGQVIRDMTGVLDHAGTTYTFLPDPLPWVAAGNASAVPVPAPTENEFTVASFNMERLFDDVNAGGDDVTMTPEAYAFRLRKASLAIRTVMQSPDILGVEEVENQATLQALAERINIDSVSAAGTNPRYAAHVVEGNDQGGIDVGFLVKTSRVTILSVTQVGKATIYTPAGAGGTALLNDRPPLVLEANIEGPLGTTSSVTVIVNHLRSLLGIDDPADGARVRDKRKRQAEFLAGYIQSRQAANATERIISIGDYNAFQFSDGFVDVVGAIQGTPAPADQVVLPAGSASEPNPPLSNLVDMLSPAERYSYVFGGNTQVLDHVLVNGPARARVSRFMYARSNADFPESLRGDDTRPERLSDHDMPVAYFVFFGAPVVTLVGDATLTVEACRQFTDPGATAFDEHLGALTVAIAGSIDPAVPGTYTRHYTASNGFATTTITRTIHVVDTTPPALTLNGSASVTIEAGSVWIDPGATATDRCGVDLTTAIQVSGQVNPSVPGTYVITYFVSDGVNPASAARTVTVVDTVAPWLSPVIVTPSSIRASGHRMVDVLVLYLSSDLTGLPACSLGVTSNQPVNGAGDGNTDVDWQVLDRHHLRVRTERAGGHSRIYTITATCVDASGNTRSAAATVTVR
jgi:predicted extracellular nuclease